MLMNTGKTLFAQLMDWCCQLNEGRSQLNV